MRQIKDVNKEAQEVIKAINKFLDVSSKIDYTFSSKEQMMLENRIRVLNDQISMLVNWKLKEKEVN